ncbi:MAG: CBS domain-containing protein [Bacteroidetes bacterium]|nr:CBS domain-containing protein [Bacteroidota bacterium]MBS1632254.1 CBS domain-containing protein [Bacteroidota bacterium]
MKKITTILSRKQPYFNVISSDTVVNEALHKMNFENIDYLIVMDDDRFLGLLSEHDIFSKAMMKKRSLDQMTVREAMNTAIPIVDSEESLEYCLKIMQIFKVHYLPVFDNFNFYGVVSSNDILNEAANNPSGFFNGEKETPVIVMD